MHSKEAYLFWSLANHLLHQEEYRFIQLSEKQDELWIEKLENKQTKIIRLLRKDLDWSNWLQRDIESVAFNGERIRKQVRHREMTVLNIYIFHHLYLLTIMRISLISPFSILNWRRQRLNLSL
ncbi:hypothetical protein MKX29_16940 [Cytobacillus sp. FSL R7-0696]|uniref:hypothetical protein n=1 Tax=Cytobacillus sp. FSL R7-0696 TaxID=2921691 RepID=UPI0030F4D9B6